MYKNKILSNGIEMPCIGMGTYPLQGYEMSKAVLSAIECGYRSFDTAYAYENESSLGVALKKVFQAFGLNRTDIFLTSKIGEKLDHGIPNGKLFYSSGPDDRKNIKYIVSKQLSETLQNLETDYLDLLLIHWPYPDYLIEIWKALEVEYFAGRTRAIGVSNCAERHLRKIFESVSVFPMVNQIELHPMNTKKGLVAFCQQNGIQVEAFSPLLVMNKKLMGNSILRTLSKKYKKSVPQIILRWDIQQDVIPIPKSANPIRLKENISIFDFELTDSEIKEIDSLNENFKGLVESIYCPGY